MTSRGSLAADVIGILYGNASGMGHLYDRLDETESLIVKPSDYSLGRGSSRTLISESGLYDEANNIGIKGLASRVW